MIEQIKQVKEFHTAFGVNAVNEPQVPAEERYLLRHRLLTEEVNELLQASIEGDKVQAAKELADVLYVAFGTALEYGMQDIIEKVFTEVHQSNMTKLDEDGKPVYREDGKVIKSNLYKPANLTPIFDLNQAINSAMGNTKKHESENGC